MLKKSLLAVVVAGSLVSGVHAADLNGYLFGNVGKTSVEIDLDGVANASSDERDTGYKVGAGVQLNSYVGIEFQYADLGEAGASSSFVSGGVVFRERFDASTSGFGGNLVGTIPLERVKLFGKLGYHRLETDLKYTISGGGLSGSGSASETEWSSSVGVGASFALLPQLEVVAEWERYRKVADEYDIDFASLGLRYNF